MKEKVFWKKKPIQFLYTITGKQEVGTHLKKLATKNKGGK